MSYLDTLIEMEQNVGNSNLPNNNKLIIIGLIEDRIALTQAQHDAFLYFYEDVMGDGDIFDFSSVLDQSYSQAQGHAQVCIAIFMRFASLEPSSQLHSWLQSAIRVIDCIVLHYLQDVLNEQPTLQGHAGVERSRYIQINKQGVKAQKAGRIMDNLYDERNKMEHFTKNDPANPGKQIMIPPNYRRVLRQIKKRLPEALMSFNEAFKDHYEVA